MRLKLIELLEKVKIEANKLKEIAQRSEMDAIQATQTAHASPSASGDRYHAVEQAKLNKQKSEQLKTFQKELEEAIKEEIPTQARPICFLKLEIGEYYFVNSPTNIEGFAFISLKSPLGQELLGKKVGENGIKVIE